MDLNIFKVERLTDDHIDEVTSFWRASMSQAIGIPPVHPFESQSYFLKNILPNDYDVRVAIDIAKSLPVAFIAFNKTEVDQLYVALDYQRKNIGSHLLELAKRNSSGTLTLRTFEVNESAQAFYVKHGFISRQGNSDNEENLPDLVLSWGPAQTIK